MQVNKTTSPGFSMDVVERVLRDNNVLPTEANIKAALNATKDSNKSRWFSHDEIERAVKRLVKNHTFGAEAKFVPNKAIDKVLVDANIPKPVAKNYRFWITPDRKTLSVNPEQLSMPRLRATAKGIGSTVNRLGGRDLTLDSGGSFDKARWVKVALKDLARKPADLETLRSAGFNIDKTQDVLVVSGSKDKEPIFLAFRPGAGQDGGVASFCSEVEVHPFGPGFPIMVKKPVIYLYPESRTPVRVEVAVQGELIATYPQGERDDDNARTVAWDVVAEPDGTLQEQRGKRRYPYLFWEAQSYGRLSIDEARAHCIARPEVAAFLEHTCERFGLNDRERTDFISYWIAALTAHPFALIQFLDEADYEKRVQMKITPTPETVIRMFMVFRGIDTVVAAGRPTLAKRERRGYTVVEWGGANLGE